MLKEQIETFQISIVSIRTNDGAASRYLHQVTAARLSRRLFSGSWDPSVSGDLCSQEASPSRCHGNGPTHVAVSQLVLSAVTCLQEEQTGLGDPEAGGTDAGQLQGARCPDSNTETALAPLEVRLSPEGKNELCKQHQQQPGSRQQRRDKHLLMAEEEPAGAAEPSGLRAFRPGHAPGARDMKQRRRALRRTTEEDLGPAGPAAAHRAKAPRIIAALDS